MLFRTHLAFSFFIYLIIIKFFSFNFSSAVVLGIFIFLGTIFVDIDSKNSRLGKNFVFRPLQLFFSHRGIIHSLLFAFLISFLIYILDKLSGIGFFIGYVSHLFLDLLTRQGVFLFWPFSKNKFSLIGIKSGGIFEEIFFVLLLLCNVFLLIKMIF